MEDVRVKEIRAYSLEGIQDLVADLGMQKFRAKQIVQWLYQKGVRSYDDMTNLSKDARRTLAEAAPLYNADVVDKQISSDGTRKYVIQFHDGTAVEMVAIPSRSRLTVCVSTQVGCGMECAFCATGTEGFTRNLLPGEIVEQVLLAQEDMGTRVTGVVAMGQGEPFQNYDNLLAALRILNSPDGLNIGARHITVSTCGIISGIRRFGDEPEQFTLAVSLHAAIQETRDELMPRVSHQSLVALHNALVTYQKKSGRRITLEYALVEDVNDNDEHRRALEEFCEGLQCHVNLIPLNPVPELGLRPSPYVRRKRFLNGLTAARIEATFRDSRGADISGACGQLKNRKA